VGGQPCERADCLLIVRPGRAPKPSEKLPPEAAAAHLVEAS
jgi:hypothetical protein